MTEQHAIEIVSALRVMSVCAILITAIYVLEFLIG